MSSIFDEEKAYLEYVKKRLAKEMEYCQKEMMEISKRYTNVLQGILFLLKP